MRSYGLSISACFATAGKRYSRYKSATCKNSQEPRSSLFLAVAVPDRTDPHLTVPECKLRTKWRDFRRGFFSPALAETGLQA